MLTNNDTQWNKLLTFDILMTSHSFLRPMEPYLLNTLHIYN